MDFSNDIPCRASRRSWLPIVGVVMLTTAPVSAQQLDSTFDVSLNGQTGNPDPGGQYLLFNVPGTLQFHEAFALGFDALGNTLYGLSAPVQALPGQTVQVPDIQVSTTPPLSVVGLEATVSQPDLTKIGALTDIQVMAELPDGSQVPVTNSATTYVSSNPAVALVSPLGVILATGPGDAIITALKEGAAATTTVSVTLPPTTTVVGLVFDESGQPAASVDVTILNQGLTATTDASGGFTIPGVLAVGPILACASSPQQPLRLFSGCSDFVDPVADGFTDAGLITLFPFLNAGFEADGAQLCGYETLGCAEPSTGEGTFPDIVLPPEGALMAFLETGPSCDCNGSPCDIGQVLASKVDVPAGAQQFRFLCNFMTGEDPSFPNDDTFTVVLTPSSGPPVELLRFSVLDLFAGKPLQGPIVYPLMTGFKLVSADVSAFAGDTVSLEFRVEDAVDSFIDTAVALDVLHFK
jgi:hypothetical protein